jgi:hypothetical protein
MTLPFRPPRPEHVPTRTSGSVFSRLDFRRPASPEFVGKPVEGGLTRAEYQRRYRDLHPQETRARKNVAHAVERGDLTRPVACELCGVACRPEAHHHGGYKDPYNVQWLCRACHLGAEADIRARRLVMARRVVQDGERTYHAYSADELIEIDSLAHHGRPGQPY